MFYYADWLKESFNAGNPAHWNCCGRVAEQNVWSDDEKARLLRIPESLTAVPGGIRYDSQRSEQANNIRKTKASQLSVSPSSATGLSSSWVWQTTTTVDDRTRHDSHAGRELFNTLACCAVCPNKLTSLGVHFCFNPRCCWPTSGSLLCASAGEDVLPACKVYQPALSQQALDLESSSLLIACFEPCFCWRVNQKNHTLSSSSLRSNAALTDTP